MRSFTYSLVALATAVTGSPYAKPATPTVIYQFPKTVTSGGILPWIENLAQRSNGDLLLDRLDVPELWSLTPSTGAASLIHEFPASKKGNASGLLGIAEYAPDKFAVNYMSYYAPSFTGIAGECGIYTVDMTASPPVTNFLLLPNLTFPNGMAAARCPEGKEGKAKYSAVLLSTDYVKGGINAVDPVSGAWKYTQFYPTLLPVTADPLIGLNGLKLVDDYLYYTVKQAYFRLSISLDDLFESLTITPTGPLDFIANPVAADDLFVLRNGTAYVSVNPLNEIVEIGLDGSTETVVGGPNDTIIAGTTSNVRGRTKSDRDVLYVATSGGQVAPVNGTFVEPGKVVAVPLR